MNLDKFTGSGSTPSRRAFWDKVADAVLASQKREGRNVSIQEHQGLGTVINFPDQTPSSAGVCPDVETLTVQFEGIVMDCGCLPANPEGGQVEPSQVTDYSVVNGIFVPTRNMALPFFWTGDGGSYNYDAFTDEDCSSFDFSDTQVVGINLICDTDGTFTVVYSLGEPTLFVATGVMIGVPATNEITCNQLIPNGTYPDLPFDLYGIARTGTALITL